MKLVKPKIKYLRRRRKEEEREEEEGAKGENGGKRVHRLAKIHTLHRPGLNRHVSFAKETTIIRDCPCIPRILRDWSPRLHNPVSSTSDDHVESTPSTSESEAPGQKGKARFPCKLCEGDHAVHRCPFLDEAKRVLDDRPVSPLRLPPGYKKLLPSPSLVENPADPPLWSVEASIIEDKPSESIPDESQKVEAAVDPVLPSEVPSSDDTVTEENKDDTVQILFITQTPMNMGAIYPFLYRRKEVRQSHTRPSIRSHLQAT
jgi:hypothetical protein